VQPEDFADATCRKLWQTIADMVQSGGTTTGNVLTGVDADVEPVNQGAQVADVPGADNPAEIATISNGLGSSTVTAGGTTIAGVHGAPGPLGRRPADVDNDRRAPGAHALEAGVRGAGQGLGADPRGRQHGIDAGPSFLERSVEQGQAAVPQAHGPGHRRHPVDGPLQRDRNLDVNALRRV